MHRNAQVRHPHGHEETNRRSGPDGQRGPGGVRRALGRAVTLAAAIDAGVDSDVDTDHPCRLAVAVPIALALANTDRPQLG